MCRRFGELIACLVPSAGKVIQHGQTYKTGKPSCLTYTCDNGRLSALSCPPPPECKDNEELKTDANVCCKSYCEPIPPPAPQCGPCPEPKCGYGQDIVMSKGKCPCPICSGPTGGYGGYGGYGGSGPSSYTAAGVAVIGFGLVLGGVKYFGKDDDDSMAVLLDPVEREQLL